MAPGHRAPANVNPDVTPLIPELSQRRANRSGYWILELRGPHRRYRLTLDQEDYIDRPAIVIILFENLESLGDPCGVRPERVAVEHEHVLVCPPLPELRQASFEHDLDGIAHRPRN